MLCNKALPISLLALHASVPQALCSKPVDPFCTLLPCRPEGTALRSSSGGAWRAARKVGPWHLARSLSIPCKRAVPMLGTCRANCPALVCVLTCAEWNISRSELEGLVDCGLLTRGELASCILSSWDSVQVRFHGGEPLDCGGGILDCGVSPQ